MPTRTHAKRIFLHYIGVIFIEIMRNSDLKLVRLKRQISGTFIDGQIQLMGDLSVMLLTLRTVF